MYTDMHRPFLGFAIYDSGLVFSTVHVLHSLVAMAVAMAKQQ